MTLTDILLLFGVAALAGLLGGWLARRFHIPRVVGYIVAGVLLGNSLLGAIPLDMVASLAPFTDFALALIGFMIGGELKLSVFQRFGSQMILIMLAEGLSACILVTALVWTFTGNLPLAVLLGALSSATAPAATVDVLWEYNSRGPLTSTILGIVALDDALALILYGFAVTFARSMLEGQSLSLVTGLAEPLMDIGIALAVGVCVGAVMTWLLQRIKDGEDVLVLATGGILLVAGVAHRLDVSLILAEMAFGVTLTNLAPNASRLAFSAIKSITPPIYILFFILVGARLQVALLPTMGMVGLLYVIGRTGGKFAGSWAGASLARAEPSVRKYLGFALFSQAGVAVGLALAIAQELGSAGPEASAVGTSVVNVIAATTFLVQIIGPPMVKFAISRAGEIPQPDEPATAEPEPTHAEH